LHGFRKLAGRNLGILRADILRRGVLDAIAGDALQIIDPDFAEGAAAS